MLVMWLILTQSVLLGCMAANPSQDTNLLSDNALEGTITPTASATPDTAARFLSWQQKMAARNSYYDAEYKFTLMYPEHWDQVNQGEFRGDDGYIKIVEYPGYRSSNRMYVCADYVFQKYSSDEEKYAEIGIMPFGFSGFGGCLVNGRSLQAQHVMVIPYDVTEQGWHYFILEFFSDGTAVSFLDLDLMRADGDKVTITSFDQVSNVEPLNETLPSGIKIQEFYVSKASLVEWGMSWNVRGIRRHEAYLQIQNEYQEMEYCSWGYLSTDHIARVEHQGSLFEASRNDEYLTVKKNGKPIFSTLKFMQWKNDQPLKLCVWNEHWTVEENGRLIQDGDILNYEYGYEDMFEWRLLADNPLYFYVENGVTNIFYDDQKLPVAYNYIPHNIFGDRYSFINPSGSDNKVWFFGVRDGAWFFTIITKE